MIHSFKEVESWEINKKYTYYSNLFRYCKSLNKKPTGSVRFVSLIAPFLRSFPIEVRGVENIPTDLSAVFVGNHSNAHDTFVIKEVFLQLRKPLTFLAARDGLDSLALFALRMLNATFIDRTDKLSIEEGILNFCSQVINGINGFIWGEATWNLHPIRPMLKLKAGVVQTALITGKPIIPVIMEYVENNQLCKKERELYSKCIVTFGKPIYVSKELNIFDQTATVQAFMEKMRKEMWSEIGVKKDSLESIDKEIYLNHLYIKKFKSFGAKYDSESEDKFLLEKENEFHIDEEGNFVPGILPLSD